MTSTTVELPDNMPALTPVERHGDLWVKRDDLFRYAGQAGGKVRTCLALARGTRPGTGLVTASARVSPQQLIVASIAARMGVPCRLHVPASRQQSETLDASVTKGAEVVAHRPGYNSVIVARAVLDATELGWTYIPFGMECQEAVDQTSRQVAGLDDPGVLPRRIVMPVGSGMSLAGVLHGLERYGLVEDGVAPPVIGVVVGADPTKRLDRYAPAFWRQMVDLVPAGMDYHHRPDRCALVRRGLVGRPLQLDPYYEAKCLPFLQPDDLFWVVGNRHPVA